MSSDKATFYKYSQLLLLLLLLLLLYCYYIIGQSADEILASLVDSSVLRKAQDGIGNQLDAQDSIGNQLELGVVGYINQLLIGWKRYPTVVMD